MPISQTVQIQNLIKRLKTPPSSEEEGVKLIGLLDQLIAASGDDERRWFQEAKGRYLLDFPYGDPTLRAELAVEALCQSLEGAPDEILFRKFDTCHHIAIAFHLRRAGTARENLETAIHWANLAFRGAEDAQVQAAQGEIHLLLGELFIARLEGERLTNLDTAENHYRSAAKLFDQQIAPDNWCRAYLGWANVMLKPVLRHRTERLNKAIRVLGETLNHLETHPNPTLKTECLMEQGVALACYPRGDDNSYIERAIAAFKQAASLCRADGQLSVWAQTQHNLGNAHLDRETGSVTLNIARAVVYFRRALDIRKQDGQSHRHAQTLNSLGTAFWELRDEHPRYLGLAREALEDVLELRLRLGRIDEALSAAHNLSRVLAAQHAWDQLLGLGERILHQNDTKLGKAQTPAEAERLVSGFGRIIDMMALAALERDGPKSALEQLQRGRGRLKPSHSAKDSASPTGVVRSVAFDELLVVFLVPLPPNPVHLILVSCTVAGHEEINTHRLDGFTQIELDQLIYGTDDIQPGWINACQAIRLKNDRGPLRHMLDIIGARLGAEFNSIWETLDANPQITRVTLAPSGALSVLPLGQSVSRDGAKLTDLKSCRIATGLRAPTIVKTVGKGRVISFADPDGSLRFGRMEGDELKSNFSETELHKGESASRAAFFQALTKADPIKLLHLSCHGLYRWADPAESYLKLADGQVTAAEIRGRIKLTGAPIVVLSACEVGITDFRNLPTENFGLPSIWLNAGASAVIAPLWPVDDFVTLNLIRELWAEPLLIEKPECALAAAVTRVATARTEQQHGGNRWTEGEGSSDPSGTSLVDLCAFQVFTA